MLRISDKRFVNEALITNVQDGVNELDHPSLAVCLVGDEFAMYFTGGERQAILAYLECNSQDWRHAGEEELK
jgi:hypothetical protein